MQCLECADKCEKDGIPADEEEIEGAKEEGIKIIYAHGVNKIIGENGKFKGIVSPRCTSVFDERGFNPKFDCSDCIELKGDILLVTVGQGIDRGLMQKEGLLDEKGRLVVDPLTLQSSKQEQVFIGGDLRRVGFMADAMRDGTVAAQSIERYLHGVDMKEGREKEFEAFGLPLRSSYKPEVDVHWVAADKRMNFEIFEEGLTLEEAKAEAKRCATCGPCASCKACVSIGLQKELHHVEVDKDICSGCGICVYVCNYGAASTNIFSTVLSLRSGLSGTDNRITSDTDMSRCKSCGMCVVACPSNARRLVGDNTKQEVAKVLASL
jgi:ferredoxin